MWLPGRPPPNLILITVDTLRADHLGVYGYPRDTSPFLDDLALRSTVFDNAFVPMSTTVPSHTSMLTGLYPIQHGIRRNGDRLRPDVSTVAEQLWAAGYATAAFVSTSAQFRPAGLDRGFQHFEDSTPKADRRASQTVDRATSWLESRDESRPLFLWVHLWDAHSPYDPEELYVDSSASLADEHLEFLLREHKVDLEIFAGRLDLLLDVTNRYDGEVRAVDTAISRLYREVESRDPAREHVWIITADHGEGLGSHRWLLHGVGIYSEQVRAPLIFHSSSGRFASGRLAHLVEHVDLASTLLDLALVPAGFEQPAGEGASLAPLLTGQGAQRNKDAVFIERRTFDRECDVSVDDAIAQLDGDTTAASLVTELVAANCEPGKVYAILDRRFKYILRTAQDDEFYDLQSDPHELNNLILEASPEKDRLLNMLEQRIARFEQQASQALSVDDEELERLRSLGYVR